MNVRIGSRLPRRIVLVACASSKRPEEARAEDLYTSALFAKSKEWAKRHGDAWLILSALHGVVRPEQVLQPYEQSLAGTSAPERRMWALWVHESLLLEHVQAGDTVVFLAGQLYRQGVEEALVAADVHVEVPMRGLTIGRQLAWLVAQNQAGTLSHL